MAASAVWWTLIHRGAVIKTRETFNQWAATAVLLFKSYIVHLCKLRLISTYCHLWQMHLLKSFIGRTRSQPHNIFSVLFKLICQFTLPSLLCMIRWWAAFYFLLPFPLQSGDLFLYLNLPIKNHWTRVTLCSRSLIFHSYNVLFTVWS